MPTLILSGESDDLGCCFITSMGKIVEISRKAKVPVRLISYPGAGHAFNVQHFKKRYQADKAADSWKAAVAFLTEYHPL